MSNSIIDKQIIYRYGYRVSYIYHKISPEEEERITEEIREIISKTLIRNAYEQKTKGIKQNISNRNNVQYKQKSLGMV